MTTKRVPVNRQRQAQITPTAIKLFVEMRRCRCTCDPDVRFPPKCDGCKRYDDLDDHLRHELDCKPWNFPTLEDPDAPLHPTCRPDEEARELWRALEAGARELRRREREARRPKVS